MKKTSVGFAQLLIVLIVAVPLVAAAADFSSMNYTVENPIIEESGGTSSSASFKVIGTIPYISAGKGSSASYGVTPGFLGFGSGAVTLPVLSAQVTATANEIELTWTETSGAVSGGYQVGQASVSGGPYTYRAIQQNAARIIANLPSGTTYFVVRALDSDSAELGLSNEVAVAFGFGGGTLPGGGGPIGPISPTTAPPPTAASVREAAGIKITDTPAVVLQKITAFVKPLITSLGKLFGFGKGEIVHGPPLPYVIPRITPLALRGEWFLLPREPIRELALAPLPRDIQLLAQKFPDFGKTLREVGVHKFADLPRARNVNLLLPGLSQSAGRRNVLGLNLSFEKLPPAVVTKVPSEIIFARAAGGKLDFDINLSVAQNGRPAQRIRTIAGNTMNLVVKPGHPVTAVRGYLVFRSRKPQSVSQAVPKEIFLASLFFTNPAFAYPSDGPPPEVEERLVLVSFEYTDPDGDGIYTADIQAPVVDGEYEVITVMDYTDPALGSKEIRLVTVIDPEGYVYERVRGQELRVSNAIVTLYYLNAAIKQYELWPAKDFQQENPQITDSRGSYSFLVPEGTYYLAVQAPGYLSYEGRPFTVDASTGGVHTNIELSTKYWLLDFLDIKTILLIAIVFLLFYNFHRDKIRDEDFHHHGAVPLPREHA